MEIYVVMKNVETFDAYEQECDGTIALNAFKTLEVANAYMKIYASDEYNVLSKTKKDDEIIMKAPEGGIGTFEVEWNNRDGYAFRHYSFWVQKIALVENAVIPKVCNAHIGVNCDYAIFDSVIDHDKCTYAKECPFSEEMAN